MPERSKFPIAVHVLAKNSDGHIAMVRRANTSYRPGFYTLPAGHLEDEESVVGAAARELKEEAGLTVTPENLQLIHILHAGLGNSDLIYLHLYFLANNWTGDLHSDDGHQDQLGWFDPDNLPSPIVPETVAALANYQHSMYTEIGWS